MSLKVYMAYIACQAHTSQHLVLLEWNDGRSNGDSTANGSGNGYTNGASGEEYEIIRSNS